MTFRQNSPVMHAVSAGCGGKKGSVDFYKIKSLKTKRVHIDYSMW